MKILIILLYTLNIIEAALQDEKVQLFHLMDNSLGIPLPNFVLIPNYRKSNETIKIEYKSFSKSTTIISSSEWILSVHVDQHFFYNNQSNEPLHALCFLQFSIEKSSRDVGKNASCKLTLSTNNTSSTANCSMKIGRPPSICSAYFDLSETNFPDSTPTWAVITAELYFSSSELVTRSINQPAIVFNSLSPVNWTVVQHDQLFGKFALGLPFESVKSGSSFTMPISITDVDDLEVIRIMVEYDQCLSLNNIKVVNKNRWEIMPYFEPDQNKESGIIRLTSLNRNRDDEESFTSRPSWRPLALINFTVTDKQSKDGCWIRAGILKLKSFSGRSGKYFKKANFQTTQKPIPISIDPVNMAMIVFPEPRNSSVQLFSTQASQKSIRIFTYLLHKTGNQYMPQLIKTIPCHFAGEFPKQTSTGCAPQFLSNSWVLPIRIEHWKTVVFNLMNDWHPESWRLQISDAELNPISDWRVYRNGRCTIMYQSAVLKIGARLSQLNSFGMRTYLGSTLNNPKQWVDLTKELDISLVTSNPPGVVILSRNSAGTVLVKVNESRSAKLYLHNARKQLLADTDVSVFSQHWASVIQVIGRCISNIDIEQMEPHPSGEGGFVNFKIKSRKLRIGDRCRLVLGVVFNDKTQLLLDDIAPSDYRINAGGEEIKSGDMITFKPQIDLLLYGSPLCSHASIIYQGIVDLGRDWKGEAKIHESTEERVEPHKTIATTRKSQTGKVAEVIIEQHNSLLIAIYCVIGVVVMALVILVLNCLVGLNVRRQSISHIHRRLSKSGGHFEGGQNSRVEHTTPQLSTQEHYPPLLPPPGPIIPSNKQAPDWGVSSESGIGLERSSLGSQQDHVGLSTFRVSLANGSMHPSDSSSYIHQTSPFSDMILESNSTFVTEQPQSPFDPQSCLSRSYWSGLSSPYRLSDHASPKDYRAVPNHHILAEDSV